MYLMSGNKNSATSLLAQLMADPTGDLLQSLRDSLQEAIEKIAAQNPNAATDPAKQEAAEALQPVFTSALEILDKATFRIEQVRQSR